MGSAEYGDVYSEKKVNGKSVVTGDNKHFVRDIKIGRLVVDFSNNQFWLRPIRGTAQRLSASEVSSLVANDLIEFDQPAERQYLVSYLMELHNKKTALRDAEVRALSNGKKASEMKSEGKLHKSVKRNVRIAKVVWTLAMVGLVAVTYVATMPAEEPDTASPSISGVGQSFGVDSSELTGATYVQALGDGTSLYGVITNQKTKETSDTSSSTASVTENIMMSPTISSSPIHTRPLYYDNTSFRQTEITVDTSSNANDGVYLQDPNGYALGVPQNELVLVRGQGLSMTSIASPTAYADKTASDSSTAIEDAQKEAAESASKSSSSSSSDTTKNTTASEMPDGWIGFDDASISSKRIAGSYWYTKGSSGKQSDLHRRIVIYDISSTLDGTSTSSSSSTDATTTDAAQLNYQDLDSNFYAPEISLDTTSNGSTYLLAYEKQDLNGNVGFFVRRIQNNEDILLESHTNTFSANDITGSNDLITNYHFIGNKMFYEQSGYIWMINMSASKLSVVVNGNDRTVSRENPVKICKASDVFASVSADEQQTATDHNTAATPIAHYTPMSITTADGIEYGITFIEASTGNLVFQPAVDITTASSGTNSGSGANSTANNVYSGTDAAVQNDMDKDASGSNTNSNLKGTMVTIPDLIGKSASDAIAALKALGFNVTTTGENGVVTSMSPSGSAVYGATITLTLGQAGSTDGSDANSTTTNPQEGLVSGYIDGMQQSAQNQGSTASMRSDKKSLIRQVEYSLTNVGATSTAASGTSTTASTASGADTQSTSGTTSVGAVTTSSDSSRIIIRNVASDKATIVAFAVRGGQVLWIEQDVTSGTRQVKFSPIYYKDVQTSSSTDDDESADSTNALDGSVNSNQDDNAVVSGSDTNQQATQQSYNGSSTSISTNGTSAQTTGRD